MANKAKKKAAEKAGAGGGGDGVPGDPKALRRAVAALQKAAAGSSQLTAAKARASAVREAAEQGGEGEGGEAGAAKAASAPKKTKAAKKKVASAKKRAAAKKKVPAKKKAVAKKKAPAKKKVAAKKKLPAKKKAGAKKKVAGGKKAAGSGSGGSRGKKRGLKEVMAGIDVEPAKVVTRANAPRVLAFHADVEVLRLVRETLADDEIAVDGAPVVERVYELAVQQKYALYVFAMEAPKVPGDVLYHMLEATFRELGRSERLPGVVYLADGLSGDEEDELRREARVKGVLTGELTAERVRKVVGGAVKRRARR